MAQEFPEIHSDFQPIIYRQVHRSTLQAQWIPISSGQKRIFQIHSPQNHHPHNIPSFTFQNRAPEYHRSLFPDVL